MHDHQASDLHLVSGQQPAIRIRGDIERIKYDILNNDTLKALSMRSRRNIKSSILRKPAMSILHMNFRACKIPRQFFQQKYGIAAVFREIPSKIATCVELGMPSVIAKLAMLPRGLVLVTGPTGSGKSTTLAAIIDEANRLRRDHIITIEDPIEFVHKSQNCIVNHREVGIHENILRSPAGRAA